MRSYYNSLHLSVLLIIIHEMWGMKLCFIRQRMFCGGWLFILYEVYLLTCQNSQYVIFFHYGYFSDLNRIFVILTVWLNYLCDIFHCILGKELDGIYYMSQYVWFMNFLKLKKFGTSQKIFVVVGGDMFPLFVDQWWFCNFYMYFSWDIRRSDLH